MDCISLWNLMPVHNSTSHEIRNRLTDFIIHCKSHKVCCRRENYEHRSFLIRLFMIDI